MVSKVAFFWLVAIATVAARKAPLHNVDQGNFRKASRQTGDIAPHDAQDIEPPWASLAAAGADGAESLGARVAADGGIELVPLTGGIDSASGADDYLAKGTWKDQLDQVGWSSLMMRTGKAQEVDDGLKMYAAGAIEGFLTAKRIGEFYRNSRKSLLMNPDNNDKLGPLKKALTQTVAGLAAMAEEGPQQQGSDSQARLALLQTWGVRDGYALANGDGKDSLSMADMFILNSDGVVDELLTALGGGSMDAALVQRKSKRQHLRGLEQDSITANYRKGIESGHCTGVVRLADGNSELYFGHTTWESFSEMTRIWKVYDFPLKDVAAKKISFSSYPGCISSTDDYYLMDSGLAITETTLSISTKQSYASSQKVPDFIRIMSANRLSESAEDWVRNMVDSATGTYSSQWMVMDYKKFTPGQPLPDGAFYVLEQAPATSHYEDMSGHLREKKYWASFDRAYFDEVRATTGDDRMQQREGSKPEAELFSKDNTPRAQIVRQTQGGITSLDAMRAEMTENKGTKEPVDQPALQVPSFAVSARSDLLDNDGNINKDGAPDGGVDSKITSACLFRTLTAQAISSPSHTSLPAFKWTGADGAELWPGYPHEGLPNEANFDWVRVDPQEQMLNPLDNGGCQ